MSDDKEYLKKQMRRKIRTNMKKSVLCAEDRKAKQGR